jgi:hypothetical protein
MPGKLHLTQPRPAAVPTDQGRQLHWLHDFSGENWKSSEFTSKPTQMMG